MKILKDEKYIGDTNDIIPIGQKVSVKNKKYTVKSYLIKNQGKINEKIMEVE